MIKSLYSVSPPMSLQGSMKKRNYFEGWYYKCVTQDKKYTCAIIPGISTGSATGELKRHAFIQFSDSQQIPPLYKPYSPNRFHHHKKPFLLHIGDSYFSSTELEIHLEEDNQCIEGNLYFGAFQDIKRSFMMPTIMGYYKYIPFMECFHGVISLFHSLYGQLTVNGKVMDFHNGTGYIEKDYGTSFPTSWIWIHSNTFTDQKTCLMCSVASIPFLRKTFLGFLCIFYFDNKEYRFATYLGGTVTKLKCNKQAIFVEITQKKFKIQIRTMAQHENILIAPKNGSMSRQVRESMSAKVKVSLYKEGKLLYEARSTNGCMELNT